MTEEDPLAELFRFKEEFSLRFKSARELMEEVERLVAEDPLPPPGKSRKMLKGVPRNISIADLFPGRMAESKRNGRHGPRKTANSNGSTATLDKPKRQSSKLGKMKRTRPIAKKGANR